MPGVSCSVFPGHDWSFESLCARTDTPGRRPRRARAHRSARHFCTPRVHDSTMSAQFATQSIARYVFVATPSRAACAHRARARARLADGARARDIAVDREDTARGSRARARRVRRAGIAHGAWRARWMWGICVHVLWGVEARRRGRGGARERAMGAWVMWWLGISLARTRGKSGSSVVACARWVRRWRWWCGEDDANGGFFATGVNAMTDAGVDCVFFVAACARAARPSRARRARPSS